MTVTTYAAAPFMDRFRSMSARARRIQCSQALCGVCLAAAAGWGLLAWSDYAWELERSARIAGFAVLIGAVVLYAGRELRLLLRAQCRPSTALDIEEAFPDLGQAVRTTVQFGSWPEDRLHEEGIAATLVAALTTRTEAQTRPLELETVLPTRMLWLKAGGMGLTLSVLAGAAVFDWEWRTALQRAVLCEIPYRQLDVLPGDVTVDEGGEVAVTIELTGRQRHEVVLETRPTGLDDAEWQARVLNAVDGGDGRKVGSEQTAVVQVSVPPATAPVALANSSVADRPRQRWSADLDRLTRELDYRVRTGRDVSPQYHVALRRPLKLLELQVTLTPPGYTRQPTTTVLDGNLSVLQGTHAEYRIAFDKPLKSASLEFVRGGPHPAGESGDSPVVIPLELAPAENASAKHTAVTRTTLAEDVNCRIVAEAEDGTRLPEVWYRVRVRIDQPPSVSFESPADAVEVHTLAELPMRVQVQDDYGLTLAGIIFQVNNEQEIPLVQEDFAVVANAAKEAENSGRLSPATRAALERVLPLEHFELTQKDSVMYFAYAEDNRPGTPQRTETDLRFIDIRPFKREYRVIDPDPLNGMGGGVELKSLEELIQRQRFALNRTIQIEKRAAAGRPSDATSIDQLMAFETELAQSSRDTALGLESRGFDDTELFYQAEAAMLQAVDSLSVGKWENATLQMRDALKFLVEQRDRTVLAIRKNPDQARLEAIREFDRMQAQKLRRPKSDKEEAKELIRRLEELASQETGVAQDLTGASSPPEAKPDPEQSPPSESPGDAAATNNDK